MIPRILHRTLPAQPPELMVRCWDTVLENTDGWEHRTYQSPRDPADFPLTGHLWHLCRDNGQQADFVRLEVLYREGGVYLDADVELLRPLDRLLGLEAFACYEDAVWLGNAVVGAVPGHPALLDAIDFLERWVRTTPPPSGPKALTEAWKGRRDVTLLPQHTFYPYLYNEMHRAGEDFSVNPETLGVHHWARTWK